MQSTRKRWLVGSILVLAAFATAIGCYHTPVETSEYAAGPVPLREPSPARESCCYEDSLTGADVFSLYCSYCHNAPALAERPFSNFQNVAAHMRVRANLTGKEYAKLIEFLRRWHDVPPPNPPVAPSPKRLIFSQPMTELRNQTAAPQSMGNPGLFPRGPQNTVDNSSPESPAIVPAQAAVPAEPPQR
jgi:hypothetical protein